MATSSARSTRKSGRAMVVLGLLGAVTLGYSAYLHARIALDRPPLFADGQVTLSGLFIAQATAAMLVAIGVLVRRSALAWLAFGAVAAGSLGALVLSVYVKVPSFGPFPVIYEPFWYQDKNLAAASAAAAVLVALVALVRMRRLAR